MVEYILAFFLHIFTLIFGSDTKHSSSKLVVSESLNVLWSVQLPFKK